MEQKVSARHIENVGAYNLPPNLFTSRVMSTIITHDHLHPTGYMCLDLSPPHDPCKQNNKNAIEKNTIDSCIKSKYKKVKDRPFADGSRGCHAIFVFGCASS